MGAKQSKRSVDISGKEAEGGGEVAVAGAGGEGRVEQLADVDALKPQLNGAAHIQQEQTEKEKDLDSGTPENEKDATTEKEGKEEEDKETEAAPVTNGDSELKAENGESTPAPEDGKKPKKEKVKKKWSLRSISFSRKDKPKQEKKQKEEEPKTNGEPEKVPEETAEATPETAVNEVAEEAKATVEEKDEKNLDTPVTEPLTNGTSTPESATVETPATEEAAPSPSLDADRPVEAKPEPERQPEPEQLPVNGLSLDEPKPEIPEVEKIEETKPELPVAETVAIVPAPEIPKEVCVEQMPLLEPTPPPLPANPPPSSVASFAATTMAPELTDASLVNTADAAIAPLSALPETKDILVQPETPTTVTVSVTLESDLPSILKETSEENPTDATHNEPEIKDSAPEATIVTDVNIPKLVDEAPKIDIETITKEIKIETADTKGSESVIEPAKIIIPDVEVVKSEASEVQTSEVDSVKIEAAENEPIVGETIIAETETTIEHKAETQSQAIVESVVAESIPEFEPTEIPEAEPEFSDADELSLPPPPVQDDTTNLDEVDEEVAESLKQIPEPIAEVKEMTESHHIPINEMTNGVDNILDNIIDAEELKKKAKAALGSAVETTECNGAAVNEEVQIVAPEVVSEEARVQNGDAARAPSPTQPPPPAELCAEPAAPEAPTASLTPQDSLPVSDKLADLIPEVPDVPELNIETLQEKVTDMAVAN